MTKYNIPFSPPDITEEEIAEVADTLRSGWITTGPKTKELERRLSEYTHTNRTVCLNSATAALELILRALEIGEGDEVIVPAMTYTASCSVITHVGATPVMVDIQENSFEMNYDLLEKAITSNTKAIIPVELAGIICDYDRIFDIVFSKQHLFKATGKLQDVFNRIVVISDSAHALGATYKNVPAGNIADFSSFSFHAVKNFTTAEGGSVTWKSHPGIDDDELYKEFQILSLHGQTKDALAKTQLGSWEYDIVKPAYKCNMTDIMASIGLVQLKRYPSLIQRRYEIVKKYDEAMDAMHIEHIQHVSDAYHSSAHLYMIRIPDISVEQRNEIITRMAENGVATNVHYKPLPMMSGYKAYGWDIKDFPNAYHLYHNEITLPLHTLLSDEDVEIVIQTLRSTLEEMKLL